LKELLKNILKKLGLYYFLQGNYRQLLFNLHKFICRIKYAKYKGTGFQCNSCGASYSKFVSSYPSAENANAITINKVIAGYGENILCPACLSTARERLIIAILKKDSKISGKKVLHFSPEKNIYNFIKINNEVITADIEPLFYKGIDKKIKKEDADATKLSFNTGSFDLVIGNHIMEHIPNDAMALQEIYRILKPGGRAILQIPYSEKISSTIEEPGINNPEKQSALYGQKDHIRIYLFSDYISRLQHAGFETTVIQYSSLQQFYTFAIQNKESFINILKPANA